LAFFNLIRTVKPCSFTLDSGVALLVRKVKVGDLEFIIFTDEKIVEFKVKMGNTILVEVFKPFDKVMEVGAD